MKMLRALTFAVAIAVTAIPVLHSASYLTSATAPNAVALLPPPPAAGSVEDDADRFLALHIYSTRTQADAALGAAENRFSVFHFEPALGPWFQPDSFPKLAALFDEIEKEAAPIINAGKGHWQRLRPCNADPKDFSAPIEKVDRANYSYPSGHATRGALFGLVLAEIFPEQRDAILAKGTQSGWLRIEGGMHYPVDVYGGRVLGTSIARTLLANPDFQRDLAAVKTEAHQYLETHSTTHSSASTQAEPVGATK